MKSLECSRCASLFRRLDRPRFVFAAPDIAVPVALSSCTLHSFRVVELHIAFFSQPELDVSIYLDVKPGAINVANCSNDVCLNH